MNFKLYLKLMLHALIATCILLSAPTIVCIILTKLNVHPVITVVSGVFSSLLFTMYPSIKYLGYVGDKLL